MISPLQIKIWYYYQNYANKWVVVGRELNNNISWEFEYGRHNNEASAKLQYMSILSKMAMIDLFRIAMQSTGLETYTVFEASKEWRKPNIEE